MEIFKSVLENKKLILTCSTDDDSDCESLCSQSKNFCKVGTYENIEIFDLNCSKPLPSKKRNGEKRMPTRRPDPNVYNRNALLARENRKRKKMYLETIEKELDAIRKANHTLTKALRRQLKIAERLEKEKKYYEDIVKNKLNILDLVNTSNFHHIQRAEANLHPAVSAKEDDTFKDVMDITTSRSSSPNQADNLSMLFDSASDGSVVAPEECSACDFSSFDFSLPEFSTDLYDSPDVTLPHTSTTWDDIWGDKCYNVDNVNSSNLTLLENGADVQSLNIDHCYARVTNGNKVDSSDQECEQCDFIDVEGICSCNGAVCADSHVFPTCHTPPTQLLNMQSS